jgi:single-stranded-DNA-specific exonuclease
LKKPDLIITVDNGISSIDGVDKAKQLGIQVLITDHHLSAEQLPEAATIVNPNQPGDKFESKNLAGCGVIFYVMLALRSYLREQNHFSTCPEPNMADLLDLVALGTVADVVKLDKNNRILVAQGLKRMQAGHMRPGIKALLHIANRDFARLCSSDLGFAVGPRLNAAGRLEDMRLGIECLLTDNYNVALAIAEQLDSLNHERKSIEGEMREQAFKILDDLQLDATMLPTGISIYDETWHQGVIGIVASRIKDKYHRPTIAFAPANDDEIKGSARSIPRLHIRDCLDLIAKQHPDLIQKFGGHAMAAGLSIAKNNFEKFKKIFAEQVKLLAAEDDLQQKIHTDGELQAQEFNLTFARQLQQAGPWGQGFPEPVFNGVFDIIDQRIVGNKHLKLILGLDNKQINAIAFNVDLNKWPNHRNTTINIVYRLEINEFNNLQSLQLIIDFII